MGLFDLGSMGKKKDDTSMQPGPQMGNMGLPVDQVSSMKQQGMSDSIIVQTLQRDGYKTHQIFDAMNQAELVSGAPRQLSDLQSAEPGGPQVFSTPPQPSYPGQQPSLPTFNQQQPPEPSQPQQQSYPQFQQPMMGMNDSSQVMTTNQVEEIAEAIIEEKWTELARGVSKIVEWKDRTEARMNELDQRLTKLQEDFGNLHTGVLGKLNEYDRNISSVGTDIKAMQKVFQQMLPSFTENVNELNRITKNMKGKSQ
jgi:hypothetical protein